MAEEVNLDQLNSLHPKLRPYVKVLLTHEFGLLRELPEINGLQCGSIVRKNRGLFADRFQLKISYCKKPLIWHVLMNGDDVTKAPDFIMEDNFLADATPASIKTKLPSLANWCPSDVNCLLNVVLELLQLYKSYQRRVKNINEMVGSDGLGNTKTVLDVTEGQTLDKCSTAEECFYDYQMPLFLLGWDKPTQHLITKVILSHYCHQISILQVNPNLQRYLFEYETLLSLAGLSKNDVEVLVPYRSPVITFLIHLNVDFSKLPTALPDSRDLVVLVVEFKENAKNTVQLVPRIELEDALGGPLELPDLSPDVSLMDYIPQLEELLQKKVELVVHQTHQRKMLYSYLVQLFEPSLINADNINFRNVSFLLELCDSFCVLNVNIPADYPESRPTLQLLSWNKSTGARSLEFNNFLSSQEASHEEIARSIFLLVKEMTIGEYRKSVPKITSSQ